MKRNESRHLALAAFVCLALTARLAAAEPPRVRIQAGTRLADAGRLEGNGYQEVQGRLMDDLGTAVTDANVALAFSGGPQPRGIRGCPGFTAPERSGPEWKLTTDRSGTFCLRADELAAGLVGTLRVPATPYFAALEEAFPVRARRGAVKLSFDAPVMEAALDRPTFVTWVTAEPSSGAGYGTPLRLSIVHAPRGGERGDVGTLDVQAGARARIEIPSTKLGAPGVGQLWVEHRGSPTVAPAKASAVLRRVAAVTLSVPPDVPPADAGADVELTVGATSAVGAVPSGWVEALHAGRAAGVGRVDAGVAKVVVTLDGARHPFGDVTLRFVPSEPWWLASEPLSVRVPITRPNPLRSLPWLIAVLGIAAWVVRAWRRPGRGKNPVAPQTTPRGRADVELLEEGPAGGGWSGIVVDAHEGTALSDVTIQIILPTFDGEGLAAATISDARGHFSLGPVRAEGQPRPRLRALARHHSTLERRLPKPGRIVVSLTSRRRAMLDRLILWTRVAGRPWTRAGEPTPGDVARTAAQQGLPAVQDWAVAVEEAAFGPVPPDEPREREVQAREPKATRSSDDR